MKIIKLLTILLIIPLITWGQMIDLNNGTNNNKLDSLQLTGSSIFGNWLKNEDGLLKWGNYTVKTTNSIVNIHPRGFDEYIGSAVSTYKGVGLSVEISNDFSFNRIKAKLSMSDAGYASEVRIYKSSQRQQSGYVPQGELIFQKVYQANEFNADYLQFMTIDMNSTITVSSGEWITVLFSSYNNSYARIRRWTTNEYSDRNHVIYMLSGGDSPFDSLWYEISNDNYCETPLLYEYIENQVTYDSLTAILGDYQNIYNTDLYLPDTIFAAIGREINIYFDALVHANDVDDLHFKIIADSGRNNNSEWRITPVTEDTFNLPIHIYDESFTLIDSISTVIVCVDTVLVLTKNDAILCIGNSLTANSAWVTELNNLLRLSTDTLNFVGTEGTGINKHEGNSGKTFAWYIENAESPFYGITIQDYITDSTTASSLEYVIINLGINDVSVGCTVRDTTYINNIVDDAQVLIDSIRSTFGGYPDCKIIISLSPIGTSDYTAYANNYHSAYCAMIYEQNLRNLHKGLLEEFENITNTWVAPVYLNVDRYWGYPWTNEPACDRCTENIIVHTNGVHPNTVGYYQMADVFFSLLKAIK